MYIKWIVCKVKDSQKNDFSIAQQQWKIMENSPGFIAQIGGFNLKNNNEACIVSFWKDKNSLQYFMDNPHDEIFLKNKQSFSYSSISINYYTQLFQMDATHSDFNKCLTNGTILRVADCETNQDYKNQFIEDQKNCWKPEMKNVKGMLGGQFATKVDTNQFIVFTFWKNLLNHTNYVDNQLPLLKKKAISVNHLHKLEGKIIALIDSWKIIGNRTIE